MRKSSIDQWSHYDPRSCRHLMTMRHDVHDWLQLARIILHDVRIDPQDGHSIHGESYDP